MANRIEGKSFFVDPSTGRLKFPKYRHDPNRLIKITDITDYKYLKDDLWNDREPGEREYLEISEIEETISLDSEFEVEPFYKLFSLKAEQLAPYEFLKGHGDDIENIIHEIEYSNLPDPFLPFDPFHKIMLKNDLLLEFSFENEIKHKEYYLNELLVKDLKEIAKKAGIKTSKVKKAELIKQILENNTPIESTQYYVYNIEKIKEILNYFYDYYLSDIKENIKRFHEVYHHALWEAVVNCSECVVIEKRARKISDRLLESREPKHQASFEKSEQIIFKGDSKQSESNSYKKLKNAIITMILIFIVFLLLKNL